MQVVKLVPYSEEKCIQDDETDKAALYTFARCIEFAEIGLATYEISAIFRAVHSTRHVMRGTLPDLARGGCVGRLQERTTEYVILATVILLFYYILFFVLRRSDY